jgi:hypothetical protein
MPDFPVIICTIIASALAIVMVVLYKRATNLAGELDTAEERNRLLGMQAKQTGAQIAALEAEKKQLFDWLDHTDKELKWHKTELETRPKTDRKVYKILTLGIKASGKSCLTLKWANPRVNLGTIEGTKIERYERTVSQVLVNDTLVDHVFEVHDWGGEHIVDALQDLMTEEFHGLLMVVDLGSKDARQIDPQRIAMQIEEFNPHALKFFFGPRTVTSCKTVVLFINKSDLIEGSPANVEAKAKALYARLIDGLQRFATQIDVKVLVGSASYGHSTHILFSHFVEQILPTSALSYQLRQQVKPDQREQLPSSEPMEHGSPTPPSVMAKAPNRTPAPPRPFTPAPTGGFSSTKATLRLSNGSSTLESTEPLLQPYRTPPASGQS